MGSKRKPISNLKSQLKKRKIRNFPKFTMETIFDRFPQLSDNILEHLDAKSLANCVEVNRKWQTTIGNQKVYLKSKIRNWSNKSGRFSKEWQMALVKIPLKLIKKLSQYFNILKGQGFRCLSNTPIHVAACDGDFELIKYFETKTENKCPKIILENPFTPRCL